MALLYGHGLQNRAIKPLTYQGRSGCKSALSNSLHIRAIWGQLFDMTTEKIINYDGAIPQEITLEDKSEVEQIKLIQQLEDDDKQTIFKLVDKMLTNKKFKDFFAKNVATL